MPPPTTHRRKRLESLQARNVDAKGEIPVADLHRGAVAGSETDGVELLNHILAVDSCGLCWWEKGDGEEEKSVDVHFEGFEGWEERRGMTLKK